MVSLLRFIASLPVLKYMGDFIAGATSEKERAGLNGYTLTRENQPHSAQIV
jgi:hypothetical protein